MGGLRFPKSGLAARHRACGPASKTQTFDIANVIRHEERSVFGISPKFPREQSRRPFSLQVGVDSNGGWDAHNIRALPADRAPQRSVPVVRYDAAVLLWNVFVSSLRTDSSSVRTD